MNELGQALKEAREEKGMTLEDIQDLTKIQKRYLMAIESGEYSRLPGNFYTRAFMKSYAEAVGIDPKEFFAEHSKELPNVKDEAEITTSRSRTRVVKKRDSKIINFLPKIAIIFVLLIVLIGIWVLMQKMMAGDTSKADGSSQGVVIKNGPDIGNGSKHVKEPKQSENKTNVSKAKDDKKDQAEGQNADANKQQIKLDNTSGQVSRYTLSGTNKLLMEIDAKDGAASWVQVSKDDPKGEKYFYSLVSNGVSGQADTMFQQDLSTVDTLYIKVGSAPNTVIKINGKVFNLPDNGTVQQIYITHQKTGS